jgi:AhpD family alkylhydroperoxidase
MAGLEQYLQSCGLEQSLLHLVKLRASQINGCAFCLDMHWRALQAMGESEQRLYSVRLTQRDENRVEEGLIGNYT